MTVQIHGRDNHSRTIGEILPDGIKINLELVKESLCRWYRKYALWNTVLERLEKDARESRKVLWADPQPMPQWEWRWDDRAPDTSDIPTYLEASVLLGRGRAYELTPF